MSRHRGSAERKGGYARGKEVALRTDTRERVTFEEPR